MLQFKSGSGHVVTAQRDLGYRPVIHVIGGVTKYLGAPEELLIILQRYNDGLNYVINGFTLVVLYKYGPIPGKDLWWTLYNYARPCLLRWREFIHAWICER